jgi:hypothetical protein
MTKCYNAWQAYQSWTRRDLEKTKEWIEANPELHALKMTIDRMKDKPDAEF